MKVAIRFCRKLKFPQSSVLLLTSNSCNAPPLSGESSANSVGMLAVKSLDERWNSTSFVKLPICVGIDPSREFESSKKYEYISVMRPSSVGSAPSKELTFR